MKIELGPERFEGALRIEPNIRVELSSDEFKLLHQAVQRDYMLRPSDERFDLLKLTDAFSRQIAEKQIPPF